MKTLARHIALLALLAIAFAGTPGHIAAMAAETVATGCHHGAGCADMNHASARCAADCAATVGFCADMAATPWCPSPQRILAIAGTPHAGWQGPPLTPPPRPLS